MGAYKQAQRLLLFSSPLGTDVLMGQSLQGVEGMSQLFDFEIELVAEVGTSIDPTAIVGNKATMTLSLTENQSSRYFNGLIASFEQTAGDEVFDFYRARMVPSLWQLTLATNCRVFQNLAVMDIIKQVISPYALSVGDETTGSYKPLDYCTQYQETDFNFISRLMEQFGIFYWFEHTENDHKIMFGDSRTAYSEVPNISTVKYSPWTGSNEDQYYSIVHDLRSTSSMLTGKHSARDYDFRGYSSTVNGPFSSGQPFGKNAMERYHFISGEGAYVKLTDKQLSSPNHGATILQAQADASDAGATVFHGTSTARTFLPGFTYDLTDHPNDDWNKTFLLTEVAHHAIQVPPYRPEEGGGTSQPYSNRFSAILSDVVYRPEKRTPKPMAHGPQTGKVVTPSGEDLYLDKYGRVCVQFFWDRDRKDHTVDNTWVRVGQPWAGLGWGTYIWPRVGDEVIIHFLHGDPDDPIVVGSVYNGTNMPKYALPGMGTRTGIVTRSSKGGGADNFNELRFEDKKGSEQIFLNAEKDMDHRVENDMRTYVMGQDSLIVDKSQLEKIGGAYNRQIGGDDIETIGGKQDVSITGIVSHKYTADHNLDVGGKSLLHVAGDQGLKIDGDKSQKVGGKYSLNITGDHAEKNANLAVESGQSVYIKGGMTVVIEAGMQLSLKVGGNFIDISPMGVSISGTMVLINSGGAAGSGAAPSPTDPDDPPAPTKPGDPDKADDGTKGGKM